MKSNIIKWLEEQYTTEGLFKEFKMITELEKKIQKAKEEKGKNKRKIYSKWKKKKKKQEKKGGKGKMNVNSKVNTKMVIIRNKKPICVKCKINKTKHKSVICFDCFCKKDIINESK